MNQPSEKQLDAVLESAFREKAGFTSWFLDHTKFRGERLVYAWSRSNHPWGTAEIAVPNPDTGVPETIKREGETDVLVVLESSSKRRYALHIENKIGGGRFKFLQPELYRARAEKWVGDPRYGSYDEWTTVLVAPSAFSSRFASDAAHFECIIHHEDLAVHLPQFGVAS